MLGLAAFNVSGHNMAPYNGGPPSVVITVEADFATYRVSVGEIPQTFERVLANALLTANQKRVE